ncbi:xanthine dehydrogenase family protein molybdopterin-binding subunit [Gluconacetobacter azotocaptans]|uniref:Xanthine dehydrogenase family protein molybdopterin-binding subunit n=1 Tax=Gluconacetobacter azotocaptans TaxID=142834 RepID=A0A7W4JSY2_9PROT|nr:xanthine dehydrogenase family protein molybdopterin-binding subunit [Gluconacetobacter azotocaptans]MBB2190331.1 xanthine dehydrogenase family protein molybdopterin-binding subunit [Gluconacetobacter azotocaptans]GBQ27526.1 aerobic-type carbon monoxide dehydrogenase large subunit CoxL/CutL [Gluconacetobacter azotocaptans DSM 13594]
MTTIRDAAQKIMQTAIGLAPERWLPGGTPDPLIGRHGAIGSSVPRVDGPRKVKGEAPFAAEVPARNMTYAALVYSTIARGHIATLETDAAQAAPGVVLVMTYRNAPRMAPPAVFMSDPRAAGASSLPVMQDDAIHWNGEPIAVILAETQEQADHAATLVRVTYTEEAASTSFEYAAAHAHRPDNVLGEPAVIEIGNAEAALAEAAHKIDRTYHTPRYSHAAIEPHAATVWWEADGQLIVHDATQMLNGTRWTLAGIFGLKEEQIRILSPFVGGGFGGKALWNHQILAIAASRLSGRPVRVALSREGVFRVSGGRTTTRQRVALGARADGTLSALIHTGIAAMTAYNNCPEQFSFPARHLYAAGSFKLEQKVADIDMVANTFMRAPGESVGTFALESAIDELADDMGLDPIELRRRIEPAKDPTSDHPFSSRHLLDAYARGAERFGWSARSPTPRARREGEWLIGMGVATATYPYYRMPGGTARITLTRAGHACVAMASHEMGMGTATVQVQATADRLGLPLTHVTFAYGDTALPPGTIAGGSSQTASIAAAVTAAGEKLVSALLKLVGNASPLAGLKAGDIVARDGGLGHRALADRFESYVSILSRANRDQVSAEAEAPMPLEVQKYAMHSYGAQFCEVRVNAVTGETRVSRFLGAFDTGRIVNPRTAASQFRGGIIMGLGLALTEETLFDERTGRIMNASLAEYHVPVHLDVPEIDVIWTDTPDPRAPLGAHGIGEIGITGVGAAVANAVYNATGRRIRDLPITLDKLLGST